jgi:hypothetical protein
LSGRLFLSFDFILLMMAENSKKVKASAMVGHNENQTSKSTKVSVDIIHPTVSTPKVALASQVPSLMSSGSVIQTIVSHDVIQRTVPAPVSQLSLEQPTPNVFEEIVEQTIPTALSKPLFQPPSPNKGFGVIAKNKSKNFPTVELMFDPIASLGFVEVIPILSKKTQFLGALSFPPSLSESERVNIEKKLMENGFFTKVAKAVNNSIVSEDKVSNKTGKPYTVYQWLFVFWMNNNLPLGPQLKSFAAKFLDVSFF